MSIKVLILDCVKKNENIRKIARNTKEFFDKLLYRLHGYSATTDEKLIYFNTFGGRSYADSPKAIYLYMLEDEKFKDYSFVWSFSNPSDYFFLENNRNTVVVKSQSKMEEDILHEAKYWITNFRMLTQYIPRRDQIYVQCWHGTPLKRLGYDLSNSDNAMNSVSEIREKYRTDAERFKYLISPSKFATEKFTTAWNLKEFGHPDTIIEEGYPRNDRLINADASDVLNIRNKLGIGNIGSKKVILYAPTWRDNQHESGIGYVYKIAVDFDRLRESLGEDYVILFRAHYLVANSFDFNKYDGFIYDASRHDDINDLYLASDLLVTDYSSVFFDYANLKRPIIFYMYDLDIYRDDLRGFYLSLDELPGHIVETEEDLIDEIKGISDWTETTEYATFSNKYNYLDDGKATERIINRVFGFGSNKEKVNEE